MYSRVKEHPGVRTIYAKRLVKEGDVDEAGVKQLIEERIRRYEDALARAKEVAAKQKSAPPEEQIVNELDGSDVVETAVAADETRKLANQISVVPEGLNLKRKLRTHMERR